jgi:proteasome lid subunit RPN8/RPN11
MTLEVIKTGKVKTCKSLTNPWSIYTTMRFLKKKDREHFYVLHLNSKLQIIGKEIISIGTLTDSIIHPREVFKGAILNNSAAIICVHNHPSGDPKPSQVDIEITKRLKQTGDIIGISVLDHMIIGSQGFISLHDYCKKINKKVSKDNLNKRKQINRALNTLTLTSEKLKETETLGKKEIQKLSRILSEAVCNIFLFIGVAPEGVKRCYKMTADYLKITPERERMGYLPLK